MHQAQEEARAAHFAKRPQPPRQRTFEEDHARTKAVLRGELSPKAPPRTSKIHDTNADKLQQAQNARINKHAAEAKKAPQVPHRKNKGSTKTVRFADDIKKQRDDQGSASVLKRPRHKNSSVAEDLNKTPTKQETCSWTKLVNTFTSAFSR